MSRFHDDLVAARRRGDAPGQVNPLAAASTPVSEGRLASFTHIPGVVPTMECSLCFALVSAHRTPDHAAWHAETGT